MSSKVAAPGLFDAGIIKRAARDAVVKLDPRRLARNPVIFVTEVVSVVVTAFFIRDLRGGEGAAFFSGQIAAWLWFTVLFANFAEAVAEGRGKAQADALRRTRSDAHAKRLVDPTGAAGMRDVYQGVSALDLKVGDVVLVEAGDLVPGDGEVIDGCASVNESAITGESAPVIREAGGDRSAVTGGTTVLSDWIRVKITAAPGSTFIDRMISLVEGAQRQKTPNELALSILLAGLTIVFLIVCVTLWPLALYSGTTLSITVLIALLVCLIPTTIGGLLSAIGIAGMDRLIRFNVIATSGRAVEAAGDVDTLAARQDRHHHLRQSHGGRIHARRRCERTGARRSRAARLARGRNAGRSLDRLAGDNGLWRRRAGPGFRARSSCPSPPIRAFPASIFRAVRCARAPLTRSSATLRPSRSISSARWSASRAPGARRSPSRENGRLLGVIHLKDIIKPDIKSRFAALRAMGIKTVMVTGDNPITAAAIASEAGVDDFIAQANARGQARLHPKGAAGRTPHRDVRRRHQRRAGARPGRCRRRHADRHAGGARSGQYGRSRQRSDQAHRNRARSASNC